MVEIKHTLRLVLENSLDEDFIDEYKTRELKIKVRDKKSR